MDGNRKVIYDIHIDIPEENLDTDLGPYKWDTINRSLRTKLSYNQYADKLTANKKWYADLIGADFVHHTRDEQYLTFLKDMQEKYPHLSEYLIINFYKLYLLEEYAKKYDEVFYVDFDVYFNTDEDFFKAWDIKEGIHVWAEDYYEEAKDWLEYNTHMKLHLRSLINKYFIAYALCVEDNMFDLKVPVINTGIIAATSEHIKKLDFMSRLDWMIKAIDRLKVEEDGMWPENIQSTFDWNNEPFFSYMVQKNEVPLVYTNGPWNFCVNYTCETKEEYDSAEKKIVHMITKRFEWIFGE